MSDKKVNLSVEGTDINLELPILKLSLIHI